MVYTLCVQAITILSANFLLCALSISMDTCTMYMYPSVDPAGDARNCQRAEDQQSDAGSNLPLIVVIVPTSVIFVGIVSLGIVGVVCVIMKVHCIPTCTCT